MDHKPDRKAPRPNDRNHQMNGKMAFSEYSLEDLKRSPHLIVSSPSPSQSLSMATKGSSPAKANCLCSPTTHIGSFRCRHHRHSGLARGVSVGSHLSELARKSAEVVGPYSP